MSVVIYLCRRGGQLVYTQSARFPATGQATVKVSACDTPELVYVQLTENLERCAVAVLILSSSSRTICLWHSTNDYERYV